MSKSKNVLFLVTGMTPAIITETIWALACDPALNDSEHWIPDEVRVLSTEHGLNQIKSKLLDSGVFEQFKTDYPVIAHLSFNAGHLHPIKNAEGEALSDLKTPEDNEFAADAINEHIAQLAKDEQIALHVSIAGGRKTMGFYAGYALSIHGRAQDRMSHVLVDERFETIGDFFYPTPVERFVLDRNGHSWDASKAKVWLAQIPFVRMMYAIKERHQIRTASFTDTVHKINEANNDIHLSFDVKNKTLRINDRIETSELSPKAFSFLCVFAEDRLNHGNGIRPPSRNSIDEQNITMDEVREITSLSERFRKFYAQIRDEFYLEDRDIDIGTKYFEVAKSELKSQLETYLGLELAAKLALIQDKRKSPFYLDVKPEAIEFV